VITVVAISTAGLWYVRAAWHRGNPVYPFLGEIVAHEGRLYADAHETLPESKSRLGRSLWGPVTAAWHVTMNPDRLGGRSHQPGVMFLAFLPGLLFVRRLGGLSTLLVIGVAYWLVWYLLRQNVRFLLPLIPIGAVGVVWVVAEMRRFPASARWVGTGLVCAILAAYTVVAAARCHEQLAVATGLESRDAYLAEVEPTWEAATASNASFGEHGHLLSLDHRAYYFKCPVTRENVYRRHTGYHQAVGRPEQLVPLLQKAGFSHLLLCENSSEEGGSSTRLCRGSWPIAGPRRGAIFPGSMGVHFRRCRWWEAALSIGAGALARIIHEPRISRQPASSKVRSVSEDNSALRPRLRVGFRWAHE